MKLLEEAHRIMNCKNFNENLFFKENQILKISDFIAYKNAFKKEIPQKEKSFFI